MRPCGAALEADLVAWLHGGSVLLSLNRYERKKNIGLALRALREVIDRHALSVGACARARLVIAGGHDPRVAENVAHLRELRALAEELDLEDRVVFLTNVTEAQRCAPCLRPAASLLRFCGWPPLVTCGSESSVPWINVTECVLSEAERGQSSAPGPAGTSALPSHRPTPGTVAPTFRLKAPRTHHACTC